MGRIEPRSLGGRPGCALDSLNARLFGDLGLRLHACQLCDLAACWCGLRLRHVSLQPASHRQSCGSAKRVDPLPRLRTVPRLGRPFATVTTPPSVLRQAEAPTQAVAAGRHQAPRTEGVPQAGIRARAKDQCGPVPASEPDRHRPNGPWSVQGVSASQPTTAITRPTITMARMISHERASASAAG